ncbi:hypothetical protein SAMN05428987_5032 [Paenibacillus sp. CF095]|nr:hypothetical protein SAMN05428987_5032 [Paenibacillus sp. CF095]
MPPGQGDGVFQSTHSYRVRPGDQAMKLQIAQFQSTHSYRVRRQTPGVITWEEYFNPRTRTECDPRIRKGLAAFPVFQSTHSYRVRLSSRKITKRMSYFNPRTRTECDSEK